MTRSKGIEGTGRRMMGASVPEELAREIDAISHAEGVAVSETIRAALYRYSSTRRTEGEFKERLRQRLEEDRELLERLGG